MSFFKEDKDYIIFEAKLEEEFENLFPDENIIFISDDSLSEIRNVEFKLDKTSITFDNEANNIDFVVEGFVNDISQYSNNYALAS